MASPQDQGPEPAELEEAARANAQALLQRWLPEGHLDDQTWLDGSGWSYHLGYHTWRGPDGQTGSGPIQFRKAQRQLQLQTARRGVQGDLEDLGLLERTPAGVKVKKPKAKWVPIVPVPADAHVLDWDLLQHDEVAWRRLQISGPPSRWWEYRGSKGELLGYVCRFDTPGQVKQIRPLLWCGSTHGWRFCDWPRPLVLYGLWELGSREKTLPVMVVEGEKTRDAAASLFPKHIVVSWPGGVNVVSQAEWGWLKGRDVVLWPDNDPEGRQAMEQVRYLCHIAKARSIKLVDIPVTLPGGWDLADPLPEDYSLEHLLETADQLPAEVIELNQRHAVVKEQGKVSVFTEEWDPDFEHHYWTSSSFSDFRNLYLNRQVLVGLVGSKSKQAEFKDLGSFWLEHEGRREYKGVVFSPRQPRPGWLNLWRGFQVEAKDGDWSLLRDHVLTNTCKGNEQHFEYLLDWLAQMVQYPDEPGRVAIVLRGRMGVGKGILASAVGHLLGPHYLHLSNSRHLTGNFNLHLRSSIFLFADEAFWAGDKQGESTLKTLITEERLPIEGKGRDLVTARNMNHIMVASNKDWVIPAGLEERRFFVLDVGDDVMQDTKYFGRLKRQLQYGGYEGLLYELMNRDLAAFDPFQAPQTEALLEQKIRSLPPELAWWLDLLQEGKLPSDEKGEGRVPFPVLTEDYRKVLGRSSWSSKGAATKLAIDLKKWTAGVRWPLTPRIEKYREFTGWNSDGSPRLADRDGRVYFLPALKACREAFERLLSQPIQWEDPDQSWRPENWDRQPEPVADEGKPY